MSESKQNSNTYSSFAEVRLPDPGPRKQTGSDRPAIVVQSSKGKIYIHNHTEPVLIRTVLDSL